MRGRVLGALEKGRMAAGITRLAHVQTTRRWSKVFAVPREWWSGFGPLSRLPLTHKSRGSNGVQRWHDGRSGDCWQPAGGWSPAVDRSPAGADLGPRHRRAAQRHCRRRGWRLEWQGHLVERRERRTAQRVEIRRPGRGAIDDRRDAARRAGPVRHRGQPRHGAVVGRCQGRDGRKSDLIGERAGMVHGGTDSPGTEDSAVHRVGKREDSPLGH